MFQSIRSRFVFCGFPVRNTVFSLFTFFSLQYVLLAPVFAWRVYNETGQTIRARISSIEGGDTSCGSWDNSDGIEIDAGENAGPNFSDTDCNPTGKRNSRLVMQLHIDGTNGDLSDGKGLFQCFVSMHGGGYVLLYAQPRPTLSDNPFFPTLGLTYPKNYYCVSHFEEHGSPAIDINGDGRFEDVVVDFSDYFNRGTSPEDLPTMTPANRDVRFLVTGDPQYWNSRIEDGVNSGVNTTADATMAKMKELKLSTKQIRGLIISGDLTQNAMDVEREAYQNSISGIRRFVFDGLGNHDIESTGISSHPDTMRELTGEKARNTAPTSRPNSDNEQFPHYSWDWHDVHFVQLDLFPGNGLDSNGLDPRNALSFLETDLQLFVGTTGRPVVLIHHYGFDGFSKDSWTDAQRAAYWNVIKDYNVVAIFTGHAHYSYRSTSFEHDFTKPASAQNRSDGRTTIPAFIAGAARGDTSGDDTTTPTYEGRFLDVTIDNCNRMTVKNMDKDGNSNRTHTIDFTTSHWGSPNKTCTGDAICQESSVVAGPSCTATANIDTGTSIGTCSQSPTGPFSLGTTTATLTCQGTSGSDTCSAQVTVADKTAPSFSSCALPTGTLECGTSLVYTLPTATDNCSSAPTVSCTPTSGSQLTLGAATISCIATDSARNMGDLCSSSVMVVDTTKPTITLNGSTSSVVECGSPYAELGANASDTCDTSVLVDIGGSVNTSVVNSYTRSYTAQDDSGNTTVVMRTIQVQDTLKPTITCPANIAVDPTSASGTVVTFSATATDVCNTTPTVTCPASGTTFAAGTHTTTTCTATDGTNQQSCSLTVKVFSTQEVAANLQTAAMALRTTGAINGGQTNSLVSHLTNIQRKIREGNINAACSQLRGFMTKLNDWVTDGTLTAAEAQPLLTSATNLSNTLGCNQ